MEAVDKSLEEFREVCSNGTYIGKGVEVLGGVTIVDAPFTGGDCGGSGVLESGHYQEAVSD